MTEKSQRLIEEDMKLLMSPVSNKFDWNEKEQGNILGSFFWLHWLTQIPGGILAAKYGTKKVYGLANFVGSLCCFAIPYSAYQSVFHLILLRVAQGLVCVSIFYKYYLIEQSTWTVLLGHMSHKI